MSRPSEFSRPKSRIRSDVFLSRQFVLFIVVGVAAASLHWLYRYVANQFVGYESALIIAYAISLVTGFTLTKHFVFPLSEKPVAQQATLFVAFHLSMFPVVYGIAFILSEFVLNQFMEQEMARGSAHALAVVAPAMVNFLLQKYIAFAA